MDIIKRLAYAIPAAAGAIGMLIPPSVMAIIYGMLSGVSIGKVLMSGVGPGLLLAVALSITVVILGKLNPSLLGGGVHIKPSATWREKIKSLKAWWSTAIIVIVVFGGMYGGVFSPSEGGAVSTFLLLLVFFLHSLTHPSLRKNTIRELLRSLKDTAITSGMIFFIYGSSTVFSNFTVLTGFTGKVGEFFSTMGFSPMTTLLGFVIIYLILGCFLDGISILCITIPVFNPIIARLGIDPIYWASVAIFSMHVGFITPPVGLDLFAAKGVAEPDVSLEDIVSGVVPFIISTTVVLVIIIAIPQLSTYLPSLLD